ncbi:hypothetical protein [Mucilaginibacter sp.]
MKKLNYLVLLVLPLGLASCKKDLKVQPAATVPPPAAVKAPTAVNSTTAYDYQKAIQAKRTIVPAE